MKILLLLGFVAIACAKVPLHKPEGPAARVPLHKPEGPQRSNVQCIACKAAIQKIEDKLTSDATEAQVAQKLHELCNKLPAGAASKCNAAVDKNLEQIFDDIKNHVDPEKICQKLKQCTTKSSERIPLKKLQRPDGQCAACKLAVGKIQQGLTSDTTQQEVAQKLHDLCNSLPTGVDKCNALVDNNLPQLFDAIKNLDPAQVCKMLNLCTKSASKQTPLKKPQRPDAQCAACKVAVGKIQQELTSDTTEAQIAQKLHDLCNSLPTGADKCNALVDNNLDQLFSAIKNLDPQQVCKMLTLCSKKV